MYTAYFGLKREPFSIAPDPRLLFMSERHREALAHLVYGVKGGGGFVLLTGEIGTGKTTVCRSFLDQVPAECRLAYIFNPRLTVPELLETVCHEFRIELAPAQGERSVKAWVDALNDFLLRSHARGESCVLVIDEAQNLSADVLEQLRLLTNLETSERKLLQVILIGQPELRDMLARPELEQLAQRVIARYHLQALTEEETAQYVRHRMEMCGLQGPLPFDRRALRRVHRLTKGVPRRINLLCDRALLGVFATGQVAVTKAVVDKAAEEAFGDPGASAMPRWRQSSWMLASAAAAGVAVIAAATQVLPQRDVRETRDMQAVAAPPKKAAPASAAPGVPGAPGARPAPVLLHDENEAWRELANDWRVTPAAGEGCADFQQRDLQCFSRKLPLALVRQLDRPGIVTLDAGTARPSYAILTGIGASSATLRAGASEQTVTLDAFAQRWDGEFATLWRSPPGYNARTQSAPAAWIAAQLAAAKGAKPASGAALKSEIRVFQLAQGLPADGAPGPMTFMQINRLAGVDEPRLRKLSPSGP